VSVTPQLAEDGVSMRIGELAKRAGLTTRTLRYWEEFGLVKPTDHRFSGERLYSKAELERVIHVRELQELLGLTLAEIRIVLESEDAVERARSARQAGASPARRVALLEQAIEAHSRLIERMDDRLARIAAFRDEWVQRGERMRERLEELRSEVGAPKQG
jgi:DNA-binding transcriptional MerR regulator